MGLGLRVRVRAAPDLHLVMPTRLAFGPCAGRHLESKGRVRVRVRVTLTLTLTLTPTLTRTPP